MIASADTPAGYIDLVNPVNWDHPLNRGRVAWCLCLPGLMGGMTSRDLAAGNNGALTNMYTPSGGWGASSGWRGVSHPGGFGSLRFDGVDDRVAIPGKTVSSFVQNTFVFTISIWLKLNSLTTRCAFTGSTLSPSEKGFFVTYEIGASVGTQAVRFLAGGGSTVIDGRTPDNVINDTGWHYITATSSAPGNNLLFYIDGRSAGATRYNSGFSGLASGPSTRDTWFGGADFSSVILLTNGYIDDYSLRSRCLSSAEVLADYEQSRMGYPDVLNRFGTVWYSIPAGAVASLFRNRSGFRPHYSSAGGL